MGPDEMLEEMLEIVRGVDNAPDKAKSMMDVVRFMAALDRMDRLCVLVKDMNAHLSRGGALPKAWRR